MRTIIGHNGQVRLERAFDSPEDKRRYVRRLFATIAARYDLITRVLSAFGAFAFISFVRVLVESGRLRWRPVVRLADRLRRVPRPVSVAWSILGAFFGLFLAGYTGVLMVGTVSSTKGMFFSSRASLTLL